MHNILSMRFLMNDSRFVNKRLDVRVATKEEFAQAINHDKFCGAMGYLKPLDKPLSEKEWHNFAKIFTAPGKTAYLPYPHVYPRRIAGEFKEDHIGTLNHVRVIVIGPSVGGGEEWMGQYGRVVLDNPTEWPTRVLWIEFPRKLRGDAVCPRALFYEESLCLALNTRIPGNPDTEVTSWD
ncbi:KOW domain-containing protein [Mycena chlorophos]|uniref:KOW domain-containing protein n=1 Tax=Mycena chlorophos TaxID=658473 RepID=A0A8H6W5Q6_MYCCL|nr:KOW domain-containing protein [Mycena chlorophos]